MPTSRPTIGVLARAGDRFARDLFAPLADRYDVELLDAPDPAVDLLWCDWADEALLAHETLNFHPLRCDMTTAISRADFLGFAASTGHTVTPIDFTKLGGN